MRTIGFIGTGTITAAMVQGLRASALGQVPVVLSPRSEAVAARLAAEYSGVEIAADNQAVADRADLLVLAVRPQVAQDVLEGLRLRAGQRVVSLIAGLDHETVRAWTGAGTVCRAIPLPFVARGRGVTPVYPPDPEVLALFDALGGGLAVEDRANFDSFAALSALMGSFFGIAGIAADWAGAQGLPEALARPYVAALFANLGEVLRESPPDLERLREEHSTRGGLNEQLFAEFSARGGEQALCEALDGVLRRIRKA